MTVIWLIASPLICPPVTAEVNYPRFCHPVGRHAPSSEPQQGDRPPVAQPAEHDRLIGQFRGTARDAVFADRGARSGSLRSSRTPSSSKVRLR